MKSPGVLLSSLRQQVCEMAELFYRRRHGGQLRHVRELSEEYSPQMWRPGLLSVTPRGVGWRPFSVWWLFHHLRLFGNRDYGMFCVYYRDELIHRSCIFPPYFRFPFMNRNDLQIGDTFTALEHRGKGVATSAIQMIVTHTERPERDLWYVVDEENVASIRVIEKAGFELVGRGHRTKRFGVRLLGTFEIEDYDVHETTL